jgi:cell division protein FtsN
LKKKATATANKFWRVQVGSFSLKKNAEATASKLRALGYQTMIVEVEKK